MRPGCHMSVVFSQGGQGRALGSGTTGWNLSFCLGLNWLDFPGKVFSYFCALVFFLCVWCVCEHSNECPLIPTRNCSQSFLLLIPWGTISQSDLELSDLAGLHSQLSPETPSWAWGYRPAATVMWGNTFTSQPSLALFSFLSFCKWVGAGAMRDWDFGVQGASFLIILKFHYFCFVFVFVAVGCQAWWEAPTCWAIYLAVVCSECRNSWETWRWRLLSCSERLPHFLSWSRGDLGWLPTG